VPGAVLLEITHFMQWTEVHCYQIGRSYGTGFL